MNGFRLSCFVQTHVLCPDKAGKKCTALTHVSVMARIDQSRTGSGDEAHGDGPATTATPPGTKDRLITDLLTPNQSCGIGR